MMGMERVREQPRGSSRSGVSAWCATAGCAELMPEGGNGHPRYAFTSVQLLRLNQRRQRGKRVGTRRR